MSTSTTANISVAKQTHTQTFIDVPALPFSLLFEIFFLNTEAIVIIDFDGYLPFDTIVVFLLSILVNSADCTFKFRECHIARDRSLRLPSEDPGTRGLIFHPAYPLLRYFYATVISSSKR